MWQTRNPLRLPTDRAERGWQLHCIESFAMKLSWHQTTRKTEMETLCKTLSVQSLTLLQHAQMHVKGNAIYCAYPQQVRIGDGSCTALNHLQWSCHGIKQPGRKRWKLCVRRFKCNVILDFFCQKNFKGEFWPIALISRANKMNNCLHSVQSLTCWPTDKSSLKFHAQMATKSPSFAKSSSTDFATS